MPDFKSKWEKLSFNKQKTLQIITGILLAALTTFFFSRSKPDNTSIMDFNILSALFVAILFPKVLEFQLDAKLKTLRIVQIIAMTVMFIVYFAIVL